MSRHHISVTVNGNKHEADVDSRMLLVHFIRETLGLTGTHIGCDTSDCGACTVILDGKAAKSCTVLAVQADEKALLTVEGLAKDGRLHPVQEGFLEKHSLQCGFCTPGMLMASYWLLQETQPNGRRDSRGHFRESLPLHGLCQDRGSSPVRGTKDESNGDTKLGDTRCGRCARNLEAWLVLISE